MSAREIKFRVWDNIFKRFVSNSDVTIKLDGQVYRTPYGELMEPENDVVLQQFTGLKDKNGDDIYEGDIIKFEKTLVRKSYLHYDYKNPILDEPVLDIWIGHVVFDNITDIDDFYTPSMLAWGVKNEHVISSLCGKIEEYNPDSYYDNTYWKIDNKNWTIIGNIFETPELLKKIDNTQTS